MERKESNKEVRPPSKLMAAGSSPAAPTNNSTPYRLRKGAALPSLEQLLADFAHRLHTAGYYGRIEVRPAPAPGACEVCGAAVPVPTSATRLTAHDNEVFISGHSYRLIGRAAVLCRVRCPAHRATPHDEAPGHLSVEWPL